MPLMHSFSWHGPLTDILTGYAERYPMPSSPTLQPQRGVGGESTLDEAVVDEVVVVVELADGTVVGESIVCNDDAPVAAEVEICAEIAVDA